MDRLYLRDVPLPPGVTLDDLYLAMTKTRDQTPLRLASGREMSALVQANVFSGIISNLFTVLLKESVVGMVQPANQTLFPDLISASLPLEVKATIRPLKGGEGHNGHASWTVVAAFLLEPDGKIDFLTLSIAYLTEEDWQYQGSQSKAADKRTQRTETWVTTPIGTAKLRDGLAYWDPRVPISNGLRRERLAIPLPIPDYSPFSAG